MGSKGYSARTTVIEYGGNRSIQATAACVWVMYGLMIGATRVIAANVIVAGAVLYSLFFRKTSQALSS